MLRSTLSVATSVSVPGFRSSSSASTFFRCIVNTADNCVVSCGVHAASDTPSFSKARMLSPTRQMVADLAASSIAREGDCRAGLGQRHIVFESLVSQAKQPLEITVVDTQTDTVTVPADVFIRKSLFRRASLVNPKVGHCAENAALQGAETSLLYLSVPHTQVQYHRGRVCNTATPCSSTYVADCTLGQLSSPRGTHLCRQLRKNYACLCCTWYSEPPETCVMCSAIHVTLRPTQCSSAVRRKTVDSGSCHAHDEPRAT